MRTVDAVLTVDTVAAVDAPLTVDTSVASDALLATDTVAAVDGGCRRPSRSRLDRVCEEVYVTAVFTYELIAHRFRDRQSGDDGGREG